MSKSVRNQLDREFAETSAEDLFDFERCDDSGSYQLSIFVEDFYSEEYPYSDPVPRYILSSSLEDIHLPAIRLEAEAQQEGLESNGKDLGTKIHTASAAIFAFTAGIIFTLGSVLLFPSTPAQEPSTHNAIALLEELNAQFEQLRLVSTPTVGSSTSFSSYNGLQLVSALEEQNALTQKELWLEVAARRDERVTAALLGRLTVPNEELQIKALLALSSPAHIHNSDVSEQLIKGIQSRFSPLLRAYSAKILAEHYPDRGIPFLQSRLTVERDSFVIAFMIRALEPKK
jgi:hypothetical protein